jgi:hypothetical protein
MEGHTGKRILFLGLPGKFEKKGHERKIHYFEGHTGKYLFQHWIFKSHHPKLGKA